MKKKFYLTLDTETATLPCANTIAENPKQKQAIAIAKPLVYDIGWTITDRNGIIYDKRNFLVQETFFVPSVFNTAYYKEKRPIYIDLLNKQEIQAMRWNDIMNILVEDLRVCNIAVAYNACFDFKKAIPFTERYIKHLYSDDFTDWEHKQELACVKIANDQSESHNPDYMTPTFEIHNETFPIADLHALACERLLNNRRYKHFCIKNKLITSSAQYFKTSAETCYQYLTKNSEFIESHTALDDARIESQILVKILKKGKIEPYLKSFPFRELGTAHEYAIQFEPKECETLAESLLEYMKGLNQKNVSYVRKCENLYDRLIYASEGIEYPIQKKGKKRND